MLKTVVKCSIPGCEEPATHKVAAPWSDGPFAELKTYAHACYLHSRPAYSNALRRRRVYTPTPGEVIGEIGVYRYEFGKLDRDLERLPEPEGVALH